MNGGEGHGREGGKGGREGMKGVWKYFRSQKPLKGLPTVVTFSFCISSLITKPNKFANLDVTVSYGPLNHQIYRKALVLSSNKESHLGPMIHY